MALPDYEWMGETQTPLKVALGLTALSVCLSFVGSGVIVFTILRHRKFSQIYHRIILGLSITDIFATTILGLSIFLIPKSTGLFIAKGNTQTCTIGGFLLIFAIAPYIYNTELAIYFFCVLVMQWNENKIVAVSEPYIHILPWLVPTIGSIVFLAQGALNPDSLFGVCDIGPYPPGCDQDSASECERGGNFHVAFYIFSAVGLMFVSIGIITTWFVCATVMKQNATMRRYSFTGDVFRVQERRRRDMMIQSVLYTFIFVMLSVVFVAPTMADKKLQTPNRSQKKLQMSILLGYCYFIYPIQGILNCMTYLRLRIRSWRESDPRKGSFWAVKQAILNGAPVSRTRLDLIAQRVHQEAENDFLKSSDQEASQPNESRTSSISLGGGEDEEIPSLE